MGFGRSSSSRFIQLSFCHFFSHNAPLCFCDVFEGSEVVAFLFYLFRYPFQFFIFLLLPQLFLLLASFLLLNIFQHFDELLSSSRLLCFSNSFFTIHQSYFYLGTAYFFQSNPFSFEFRMLFKLSWFSKVPISVVFAPLSSWLLHFP